MTSRSPLSSPTRCARCSPTSRSKPITPPSRDTLAALLWPDQPERAARRNLSQALFNLRQAIHDDRVSPPFLDITRGAVQFNVASDHWLDARAFGEHIAATKTHAHPSLETCEPCIQHLEQAAQLYRGEFLAGFLVDDSAPFSEWAAIWRERFHRDVLTALWCLAEHYEHRQDYERAQHHARRQVELEPWREEAHQQLMRLLARTGQRSAALAQYETCRRVLDEELGAEPSPETMSLYELIRNAEGDINARLSILARRPTAPLPPCPYRGLRAFREQDAPFFFGREEFTQRLVAAARRQSLVAVIGPSGSGKSSAVFAGLAHQVDGSSCVAAFRPGKQPFDALAAALVPLLEHTKTTRLAEELSEGRISISDIAEQVLRSKPGIDRLFLIADQFEEIFTLCSDATACRRFLDRLIANVHANGAFTFVLTMRADFMEQALAYRPLADILQDASIVLGPMTRAELGRAIENPARQQGVGFEAGLIERILNDVGNAPGNLPLLEFTLTALWERQTAGSLLTHAAYEALGKVSGSLSGYADQVYARFSKEERQKIRRVLLQMVQPGEGTDDTRRLAVRGEVDAEDWRLVAQLADARLVVTSRDPAGQETIELAHETLIRSWERLQMWLSQDRAFRIWQERIRVALRQWQASERDEGALLRGALLAEAEEWADARATDLSIVEREFIQTSIALRDRELRAAEETRQRELAHAHALADAEHKRAEEQSRASRRMRSLMVGLASVFLVAVIAAILAVSQGLIAESRRVAAETERDRANLHAARARSGELAAKSIHVLGTQHELALLLAIEAGRAHPSQEVYAALTQSFLRRTQTFHVLSGHKGQVTDVAWDNTGNRLATTSVDGTARIWDAEVGTATKILTGHTSAVLQADWHPNGTRLLTAGADHTARIWDAANGTELRVLSGHADEVRHAAWSPDGNYVVTASADQTVRIWNATTGISIAVLNARTRAVERAAWNPDGTLLLTTGDDRVARIWNIAPVLATNAPVVLTATHSIALAGHTDAILAATFSPDGNRVATASADKTARVWNVKTKSESRVLAGHTAGVLDIAWSPDGKRVVTASEDGTARTWNPDTGAQLALLSGHPGAVLRAAWSPDGKTIATVGKDRAARLWNANNGALLDTLTGHDDWIAQIAWNRAGTRLATASKDYTARVWNPDSRTKLIALSGHTTRVSSAQWNGDGTQISTTSDDDTVRIWDVATSEEKMILVGQRDMMLRAPWNRESTHIVTTSKDGIARIWDLRNGIQTTVYRRHLAPVLLVDWDPAGRRVLTADDNGSIRVWDAATGRDLIAPARQSERLYHVAWDGAGERFVVTGEDRNMWTWDSRKGEIATTFHGHTAGIYYAAWSPDGTRLASASKDGTARIWDANDGKELVVLKGHSGEIWHVTWDAAGKRVITAGADGTARVWDAKTGAQTSVLAGHTAGLCCASWNADGTRIVTGSQDGTARVWNAEQSSNAPVLLRELGHADALSQSDWHRAGTHLLTISRDGIAQVWDANSGKELMTVAGLASQPERPRQANVRIIPAADDPVPQVFFTSMADLLETACARAVRNMSRQEWKIYMGDEPYRKTCPRLTAETE